MCLMIRVNMVSMDLHGYSIPVCELVVDGYDFQEPISDAVYMSHTLYGLVMPH